MDRTEFDKFADEYRLLHQVNIAASGETPEYFSEYKIKDLQRLLNREGIECGRLLDFGAGVGSSVPFFRKHLPNVQLACADVSVKSLEIGSSKFGNDTRFLAFDGSHLPFRDGVFDCVFAACVFHHIPPQEHIPLFTELRRVLKRGGVIMLFEHNPLNPLTVHAVNTCPFDENAILISARTLKSRLISAGFTGPRIQYRVFFPRALRGLRPIEQWLTWLPLGAQYYVSAKR